MKRKDYQKPTILVAHLQTGLLMTSHTEQMEKPTDYEEGGNPFSF